MTVTVTASVAGGTMQARQGAFGAANVAGMVNGDAARLRATTAATSGTATDVVLSFGATSDTWTLTTQAAAGNQVTLATSSVPFTSNHNFDTAHTYTAVPFPAGRPLVLLEMNGGQAPFSVQMNGAAAQVVISDGGRLVALGAAVLAAGSYDVKVTTGNPDKAFNAAIMHAGAITNAAAGNPIVGTASLGYQYRGDDDQAVGQAIAIPTSGLAVILYYNGTADCTLPTGYTLARDMGDGWYWITTTASDTYHIKSDDYGNTMILAVGFKA
ncbi:hypothetical protein D9601_08475 [Sphingomonas sp. MA1305]|nr:hypothetical protein [Sphingomonas sp. MA1305]